MLMTLLPNDTEVGPLEESNARASMWVREAGSVRLPMERPRNALSAMRVTLRLPLPPVTGSASGSAGAPEGELQLVTVRSSPLRVTFSVQTPEVRVPEVVVPLYVYAAWAWVAASMMPAASVSSVLFVFMVLSLVIY